jgi:hypothetical protein
LKDGEEAQLVCVLRKVGGLSPSAVKRFERKIFKMQDKC